MKSAGLSLNFILLRTATETLEDMEEVQAFNKIRYDKGYEKRKRLKHGFSYLQTINIVPKPLTVSVARANGFGEINRTHSLLKKTKHIKGLKINYHEQLVSQ
jgi:hypothetical protein